MSKTAKEIVNDIDYLKGERANWENYYQVLAKYCIPYKAYINRTRTPGQKLDWDVYDSTGISSAQTFASGLETHLTSASQRWFTLALQDRELMKSKTVKVWLKAVEDKIYDVLNGSNFNEQILESYLDLGVFGTATLYEEEDPEDIVRFSARPPEEMFFVENARKKITTVYRVYKLTAKQAEEQWGQNAGKNIEEALAAKKFEEKFEFVHYVSERGVRDVSKKDAKNKRFASIFVNKAANKKVAEGGYDEFPFFVPRFYKVSGEKHGYSPAMVSLPDILMINNMDETIIKAAQLAVAPPLQLPHDGYLLPIRTSPNSLNFKNPAADPNAKIEPLFTGADVRLGIEVEDRRKETIQRNFFVDLFLALTQAKGKMTATEVIERANEKMSLLGSSIGRLMKELLSPIIIRTFNILARIPGMLLTQPEEIKGKDFTIEYISILARAQKRAESKGIDNFLLRVNGIAQIIPETVDKINADNTVDELAKIEGISPVIVRDEKEVKVIRDARAAAEAQQAQLVAAQTMAQTVKTGSEAAKNLETEK